MSVIQFYEEQRRNIAKSYVLITFFIILMATFGLIIDYLFEIFPRFTLIFLGIALIQVMIASFAGPNLVLASVGARPINVADPEQAQLKNIVEELCIAAGATSRPQIYVIPDDKTINAFATGLRKDKTYVCVTSGLLKNLDRAETQGVVAHELSHIQNRDILYMTLISAILGAVVIIQVFAFKGAWLAASSGGGGSRKDSSGCGYAMIFLLVVGILASIFAFLGRIVLFAVSRQREYLSDAHAVELTRNPYGLSSALRKIAMVPSKVKTASIATAHLFISDPLKRKVNERSSGFWANLFSTHPPLYYRIARLEGKGPEQVQRELEQA